MFFWKNWSSDFFQKHPILFCLYLSNQVKDVKANFNILSLLSLSIISPEPRNGWKKNVVFLSWILISISKFWVQSQWFTLSGGLEIGETNWHSLVIVIDSNHFIWNYCVFCRINEVKINLNLICHLGKFRASQSQLWVVRVGQVAKLGHPEATLRLKVWLRASINRILSFLVTYLEFGISQSPKSAWKYLCIQCLSKDLSIQKRKDICKSFSSFQW